jgi:hypothetical protein
MSHVATGIVQRRKVGSPTRKAVLMFMAACASDDGTGIWTSKQNMADDLEMGKRTVQVCIDDLAKDGLIAEVGRRSCRNGFTVEYRINLDAVQALPETRDNSATRAAPAPQVTRAAPAPVQDVHVTRAAPAPQDVQHLHPNHTGTIKEPSLKKVRDALLSVLSIEVADAFIAHRKAKRSTMTAHAAELIAKSLSGHHDPDAVVNLSIQNGWTGVFPDSVKPETNSQQKAKSNGWSDTWRGIISDARMADGSDCNTVVPLLPPGR